MADEQQAQNVCIVTKQQAKQLGLTFYFTGKPCCRGHIAQRRTKDGHCQLCAREDVLAFYYRNLDANRAKSREAGRRRYRENPEILRARSNAWQLANPEKVKGRQKARYHENKEAELKRAKEWRESNPQRVKLLREKWYRENYDKARAQNKIRARIWLQNNQDLARAHSAKRRAAKLGSNEHHTKSDIARLKVTQKNRCAHPWCKASLRNYFEVDHVIPLALGGSNGPRNLQLLCKPCNRKKHAKHPIDFARENGMLL